MRGKTRRVWRVIRSLFYKTNELKKKGKKGAIGRVKRAK
jgi:hypothetical protein